MKKYIVKTKMKSIKPMLSEEEIKVEIDLAFKGISPQKTDKEIDVFAIREISQETFNFIDSICNVELDSFGNKFYVCNKIRMEIKEKQTT